MARGANLNSWLRGVANAEAEVVEAQVRRLEFEKSQREALLRAKRGEFR